jgi:hypothetical protein
MALFKIKGIALARLILRTLITNFLVIDCAKSDTEGTGKVLGDTTE